MDSFFFAPVCQKVYIQELKKQVSGWGSNSPDGVTWFSAVLKTLAGRAHLVFLPVELRFDHSA